MTPLQPQVKRSAVSAQASPDEDATSSNESSPGTGAQARKHKRVRKSTYLVRKEETARLGREVAALEARLTELKDRRDDSDIVEKAITNAILREVRRGQQLSLAEVQSAVSGSLNIENESPLHTPIRLGTDWGERRSTLLNISQRKLRDASDYLAARSKFLDPLKPHRSEEQYETDDGDFCCTRFDLLQIEGVESVKQVYDALVFHILNIEITVTQHMDQVTLREDYDSIGSNISNFRLLTIKSGVTVESNLVAFTEYYESHKLANSAPYAILVLDYVDEDALYPHRPSERLRKDVSKALVLTPHMRKKANAGGDGEEEEELVVVLAQCKFLRLRKAGFDVDPRALREIRDSVSWTAVQFMALNELV
ncbi:hypothetical protein PybrP1_010401 [[Pythium] brassicae (nom. inval.)]|nr:hypothetical protein PybrP1_010401 [[Pythium] brassicae (nom. inval.)]